MRYPKYAIFFTVALCFSVFALFIIHYSLFTVSAQNFVGPTQSAGVGQGAIGVDSSNNLAIGTSTPQADTKLLIVGTSTTGGYFAIKVLDINRGPLFIVRSDGSVSIGSPYVQSNQSSATTTVSGVGAAPSNGALFVNGPIFTTLDLKANGLAIGTSTPQSGGNAYITGTLTAGALSGSYSGTISAANTSAGAFGSNTGGGNYSFPASISVSTTTAPTGGVATFMGNVGIGTTGPSAKLDVVGNIALTAGGTAFRSINFQNTGGTMTFGKEGSAAGTLLTGDSAYANVLTTNDTNPIQFGVNDSVKMTILSTGNVGIGTTGPLVKLEIQDSGGLPTIKMHKPGVVEYNFGIDSSNTLHIGSPGLMSLTDTRPFVLTTGGNVGLGTTAPGARVETLATTEQLRLSYDSTNYVPFTVNSTGGITIGRYGAITPRNLLTMQARLAADGAAQLTLEPSIRNTGTTISGSVYGLKIAPDKRDESAGDEVTNYYGIYALNPTGLGTITNVYGAYFEGNVGIGTVSPGARLHVNGDSEAIRIERDVSTNGATTGLNFYLQNAGGGVVQYAGLYGYINSNTSGANNGGLAFYTAANNSSMGERVRIDNAGNVGIGTTAPSSTLHVVGTASFSQPVIVGTPTATGHAATKSYVDSTVGGSIGGTAANALACSGDSVCDMSGANLNGGSITGVNKLTVTTIDPLYSINGVKYSTYAASFAGGVKEEFVGKGQLTLLKSEISNPKYETNSNVQNSKQKGLRFSASNLEFAEQTYQYIIDFDKIPVGSDLWVWYKAVDFSRDNVEAIATPYGQTANIWYEIEAKKIIFHGDKPAEFSFRLTGKRFDWQKWPTLAPDQTEETSLIIN